MPLISVLMCTYKEPISYVSKAIESVITQSLDDFELIIIVDDPDNKEVINYLIMQSKKDCRVKIFIRDENCGLPASLNKAISLSNGSYIARMDADDICEEKRFEKEFNFLIDKKYDLISCNFCSFSDDGAENNVIIHPETHEECLRVIRKRDCLCHPGWFGKREVFIKLNGYREIFSCEDYDFVLRAVLLGFKIGNIQEVLIHYRINVYGISQKNNIRQKLLTFFLAEKYRKSKYPSIDEINNYIYSIEFADNMKKEEELRNIKNKYRIEKNILKKIVLLSQILFNRWFWYGYLNK